MMDRPIVVTGATGFIGKRFLSQAIEKGHSMRVLARSPGDLPVGGPVEAFEWRAGSELPSEAFEGAGAVVHIAAFIPPNYGDPAYAEECLKVNALGTLALLQAAKAAGVRKFVYLSSGQAYVPQGRLAKEDDPVYPAQRATFYLASKVAGETYVEHFRLAHGISTASLRIASVYGPGMHGGVITTFLDRLRKREKLQLNDGGRHTVDFVHSDDVAAASLLAAESTADGLFNIGSGRGATMLELAETIADLHGKGAEVLDIQPATGHGPQGFAGLDIARAREELGYSPRTLREGLQTLID